LGKLGFFEVVFRGDVGFWGKTGSTSSLQDGVWWVSLRGLGKAGKKKSVKKREKVQKSE